MSGWFPPPRRLTRGIALVLGIPFFAGLVLLTLTPARVEQSMPNLLDLVLSGAHRLGWESLDFTRLEIIANVLVFVPIGILAFILVPRRLWPLAVIIGPALSLSIEVAQRVALPHRAATLTDVLANSGGALIGVFLAIAGTLLFAPHTPQHPPRTLEAS
ncbi:VanZ family protein [Microbacterium sp. ISL-103]|jgi:glycopeptide antibiotics resistance protein|uniref:VanZ family protein n=1 Tax=Microbacterium sp. ISL-103 TaxID=2819156 RepID=UPI001BE58493|nr:VanZ family protein [Microbacterium sp. ISL-103]MBT2473923.1 VanZ family protein [Microbacterium sp. ISL-103]